MDKSKRVAKKTLIAEFKIPYAWVLKNDHATCFICSFLMQWQSAANKGRYIIKGLPCFISSIPLIAGETGASIRKTRDTLEKLERENLLARTNLGNKIYFYVKSEELQAYLSK